MADPIKFFNPVENYQKGTTLQNAGNFDLKDQYEQDQAALRQEGLTLQQEANTQYDAAVNAYAHFVALQNGIDMATYEADKQSYKEGLMNLSGPEQRSALEDMLKYVKEKGFVSSSLFSNSTEKLGAKLNDFMGTISQIDDVEAKVFAQREYFSGKSAYMSAENAMSSSVKEGTAYNPEEHKQYSTLMANYATYKEENCCEWEVPSLNTSSPSPKQAEPAIETKPIAEEKTVTPKTNPLPNRASEPKEATSEKTVKSGAASSKGDYNVDYHTMLDEKYGDELAGKNINIEKADGTNLSLNAMQALHLLGERGYKLLTEKADAAQIALAEKYAAIGNIDIKNDKGEVIASYDVTKPAKEIHYEHTLPELEIVAKNEQTPLEARPISPVIPTKSLEEHAAEKMTQMQNQRLADENALDEAGIWMVNSDKFKDRHLKGMEETAAKFDSPQEFLDHVKGIVSGKEKLDNDLWADKKKEQNGISSREQMALNTDRAGLLNNTPDTLSIPEAKKAEVSNIAANLKGNIIPETIAPLEKLDVKSAVDFLKDFKPLEVDPAIGAMLNNAPNMGGKAAGEMGRF